MKSSLNQHRSFCFLSLCLLNIFLILSVPSLSIALSFGIEAHIDGRDQLIFYRNTLQWHHFDFASVGRHLGANSPTIIDSSSFYQQEWIPEWPEPPPAEIRYEAYSSIFENLIPTFPIDSIPWSIRKLFGRGETKIVQQPTSINDYTMIVEFDDNIYGGSRFYGVEISARSNPVPEPATLILLSFGLVGLAGYSRRKFKNN